MDINVSSQIVVQTAAQWAADVTVYSAKRILVVSDAYFGATDQRKFKIADGVQTFANLDYMPLSGYDDATSSIQTQINGKQASLGYTAEDSANKSSSYTSSSTTTYPNTKALVDGLATKGSGNALTSNPLSQFAATTSAQLAGVISDETGSGALVFGTSPTFTTDTNITTNVTTGAMQSIITNTDNVGVSSNVGIKLVNGANNNSQIYLLSGQNGTSPNALIISNSANTSIRTLISGVTATITSSSSFQSLVGGDFAATSLSNANDLKVRNTAAATSGAAQSSNRLLLEGRAWNSGSGNAAMQSYFQYITTTNNAATTVHKLALFLGSTSVAASEQFSINSNGVVNFSPIVSATGAVTMFQITPASNTNQTASTEVKTFDIATATIQHATGALTTQRFAVINAPTYSFVAASTITNAATLAITGNAIAGTNATITNALALWIQSGKVQIDGSITATTYNNTPCSITCAASDETTALTTGTGKITFRMPYAMTLTAVRASVTTAATGATLLTVDINEGGTSILSTKLTFDASEKTTTTAATPAVISDTTLADDAEITIDIDAVGNTIAGAGLKVTLIGTRA